jgi:DNA-binding XRE family transcriptional regulator
MASELPHKATGSLAPSVQSSLCPTRRGLPCRKQFNAECAKFVVNRLRGAVRVFIVGPKGKNGMKGKKLKKLRRDAGLTQYGLAKATGIQRWRVAHAESGILTLTPEEVELVRKALLERVRQRSKSMENDLGREEIGQRSV